MPKIHPGVKTQLNDVKAFGIPICEQTMQEIFANRKLKDYDSDLHFKSSVVTMIKQYHTALTELIEVVEKMKG